MPKTDEFKNRKSDVNCMDVTHGYHFSAISGNLEMSGNSVKVSEKSKVRERSGNLCIREI